MYLYMGEMVTKKPPKTPKEFECKFCDFKCSNKKDYNRHLLTRKHEMDLIVVHLMKILITGTYQVLQIWKKCFVKHHHSINH